jgi:predicted SprT family Zn-dependent metalloprotease
MKDFAKRAEELLEYIENNLDKDVGQDDIFKKTLTYALLANVYELRKMQKTSFRSRKAEDGDFATLYCKVCQKETTFIYQHKKTLDIKLWKCTECGKSATSS